MAQEPGFAQDARILGLRNAVSLDGDADVIAVAAAERAYSMIHLHKNRFPFPVSRSPLNTMGNLNG